MSVLTLIDVTKVYAARNGAVSRRALDRIGLEIQDGEFAAVMGPSGAGKTTMLNIVALVDRPDTGSVLVDGADVLGLSGDELAAFRRRAIGFVFQDASLIDTMTLEENIALPLAFDRAPAEAIRARVSALGAALGIEEELGRFPCDVSGGQRQRAACARALACGPRLLLADEPTGALDSKAGRDLMECFASLKASGAGSILMVTHDPFAASWSDRVLFLRDGRLFTEIRRTGDRRAFFDRIMEVQAAMEGGTR
jgi:putative ABC transport system ATP-binding protein